ncbi:MucBP domain-containing protein [Carnobacterium sp.]|uniref:MucBP domain-containing protein n=1 Tax=Carnobacterium sp. TaxID=48221 RepID=UPI002FC82382
MKKKYSLLLLMVVSLFFAFANQETLKVEGVTPITQENSSNEEEVIKEAEQSSVVTELPVEELNEASSYEYKQFNVEDYLTRSGTGTPADYGLIEAGWVKHTGTLLEGDTKGLPLQTDISSFKFTLSGKSYTGYLGIGGDRLSNPVQNNYWRVGTPRASSLSYRVVPDGEASLSYLYKVNNGSTTFTKVLAANEAINSGSNRAATLQMPTIVDDGLTTTIYTQTSADGKTIGVQIRGSNAGYEVRSTMIPLADGRVRHIQEVKNTTTGAKNVGFVRRIDTELNQVDGVPIYSLGNRKGAYINNNDTQKYRVTMPVTADNLNPPDTYEAQAFGAFYSATSGGAGITVPFGNSMAGEGAKIDTPLGGVLMAGGGASSTAGDTSLYYKWNVQQLAAGATRILTYDVALSNFEDPELVAPNLFITDKNITLSKTDPPYTLTGQWQDTDSMNVSVYQNTNNVGFVKFADGARPATPTDAKIDFNYVIDPSTLNEGANTIQFKVIDPMTLESTIETVTVTIGSKTKVTTRYMANGVEIEDPVTQEFALGATYTTDSKEALIKAEKGYVLIAQPSNASGIISSSANVDVVYEFTKGQIELVVKHMGFAGELLELEPPRIIEMLSLYTTSANTFGDYTLFSETPNANGIAGTENILVIYKYTKNKRTLVKVPPVIDFGKQSLILSGAKEVYPTDKIAVDISDGLSKSWDLRLRISDPMMNVSKTKSLKGTFKFRKIGGNVVGITDTLTTVHSKSPTQPLSDVHLEWDSTAKEGLFFIQDVGNSKEAYSGKFEWVLEDGL